MSADHPDTLIYLHSSGVSLLLDVPSGGLAAVLHWGGDLGPLTETDAQEVRRTAVPLIPPSTADQPMRVDLLPQLHTGWMGRPGLSGSRDGRDWSPRFRTTGITYTPADGHSLESPGEPGAGGAARTEPAEAVDSRQGDTAQPAVGFLTAGPGTLHLEAADARIGLRLEVQIELAPGGLLRSRARLTNDGDPYTVDDLVLAYPVPRDAREILDFAGRWGKEKMPQRHVLGTGVHLRTNRRGRTGADSAGILHLGRPGFGFADGEVWAAHVGFSGNHTHYAERVSTGEQVIGGGELLLPGEIRLEAGESYTSPWLYGGYGVGLDEVAARFHRFLRSRPSHVDSARPVTLNVWEAVYFDHDLPRLLDLAQRAAAIGVERFVLDDGWFGARRDDRAGLGDWVVSPDVWPDGLHPLVDEVRALGMQFGLWFEPEMVNPDSDVARAHPEWIMTARPSTRSRGEPMAQPSGEPTTSPTGAVAEPAARPGAWPAQWPLPARLQQVLNLAIPECYQHIRGQMLALLDEYEISYLKWDHNRDLIEAGDATRGGRPSVHAQTLACYRLMDELKEAHPELEIESCSSGGARVDLGIMERCDRVWVSDCIDPLERQQMNRWTMQLLPPELLGSHIASGRSHTTGRVHDLPFRAGTAMLGHLGVEWDLRTATTKELAELRDWIDYYRERRDHLLTGDLVRVDTDDTLNLYGIVSSDRRRATFFAATIGRSEVSPRPRLRFRGLDPDRRYRVRPVIVGQQPSGLEAPEWWTAPGELAEVGPLDPAHPYPPPQFSGRRCSGAVFTGAALARAGVASPMLHPEQIVLYELEAVHSDGD